MSIDHIATPLDSATLDSKEQYIFYHKLVDFVLKEFIVKAQENAICNESEIVLLNQYKDLLLYSVEAMRIKYMYDEDNMKVDLTDSGFPNYLEFRYLYNDLSLRDEYSTKLTDIAVLQEDFLETLLQKKEVVKKKKLFQAASIIYYTAVEKKYIFNRFVQGKIIDLDKKASSQYMTSWSFYDVSFNRPFICVMYFDYDKKISENDKTKIYEVLKTIADRKMPIDTMAYTIDRKIPDLMPNLIKRIDLGPIHTVFAKDENMITHAILEAISKKEISLESYALSLSVDAVVSDSTFKEGSFFSKQTLQKWKTIQMKQYVFAPHRIIQLLYNKTPEVINKLSKPPIQTADLSKD